MNKLNLLGKKLADRRAAMKNDPSQEKIDLASLNLGKVVHVA